MARRSFIGNAYFKVQDPNLIGKMSGHVEGSSVFTRYLKIEDATLKKVIDLMGQGRIYAQSMKSLQVILRVALSLEMHISK